MWTCLHQPLADLQRHVADEAVTNDNVHGAVVEVPPLHVANKIEGQLFQEPEGFPRQLIAFVFFLANGKQAMRGFSTPKMTRW